MATIRQQTNEVLELQKAIPMHESSIVYYRKCFNALVKYCDEKQIRTFTEKTYGQYLQYQTKRVEFGAIGRIYWSSLRKAAEMLLEYQSAGEINWHRRNPPKPPLCTCFEQSLNDFRLAVKRQLAEGSVKLLLQTARQMLEFFEQSGYHDYNRMNIGLVQSFLTFIKPKYKSHISNVVWVIRRYFSYLNESGKCLLNVAPMLASVTRPRKKVLPRFSDDEVVSLMSAANGYTECGKRDYAMMKMAVETGMRACDIVNLKLSEIDWRANTLRLTQKKTGEYLCLPLSAEAGNAVADYILNYRPAVSDEHVFLRFKSPNAKLGKTAAANCIKRYLDKAGVEHEAYDGKTFHAFRRTVGTRLIESEAGLEMTAQMLGLVKIDTAKRYISLDEEALRECQMPLGGFGCTREGLA
jgi:site-specific recombinase XerD